MASLRYFFVALLIRISEMLVNNNSVFISNDNSKEAKEGLKFFVKHVLDTAKLTIIQEAINENSQLHNFVHLGFNLLQKKISIY